MLLVHAFVSSCSYYFKGRFETTTFLHAAFRLSEDLMFHVRKSALKKEEIQSVPSLVDSATTVTQDDNITPSTFLAGEHSNKCAADPNDGA